MWVSDMKNVLSYILILFLFATAIEASNFTEEKVEKVDDVELVETEKGAEKDEAIILKREERLYKINFSFFRRSIELQIRNQEVVVFESLKTPLYILFDSFLI